MEQPEEYSGLPVIKKEKLSVDIQVKDNIFVKVSPTAKTLFLLESADLKLHFKILSKCTDVPFADTFSIEEDWLCLAPLQTSPCIVRI